MKLSLKKFIKKMSTLQTGHLKSGSLLQISDKYRKYTYLFAACLHSVQLTRHENTNALILRNEDELVEKKI